MRAERALAGTLMLLAVTLLVACGADEEPASRSATTTTRAAVTSTTATTAAAAATRAAATSAVAGAAGATPVLGSNGDNEQDIACRSASGARTPQAAGASVDATTTTPLDGTTTPTEATTTPTDATTTTEDATTTPEDATTTPATTTEADASGTVTTADGDDPEAANGDSVVTADQLTLARPFSSTSPWNTPVDAAVVDPRSTDWIAHAARRVAVVASTNRRSVTTTERDAPKLGLFVNTCAWTPTIVGEDGGETVQIVCRQRNCGTVAKEVKTLRVTRGVDPFPEFDGWFSVIDQSAGIGYDLWRARRVGDVISYQFIKRWRLNGPGFSPPATVNPAAAVGARGSGLPLFAGVVQPSELRQGRIDHALALSVPGPAQRVFVQPASVTNGINTIGSLPEGSRLRLKASYKVGKLPRGANRRSAETLVTALRTYGAIVVDRSITPTLYARRSTNYGTLLLGNELQNIRLRDLEVVQSGPLMRFPPLESTPEQVQR